MTLDEIRQRIAGTARTDWHAVAGDGLPIGRDRFGQVEGGGQVWLEHDSHHSRAVLRDDLAIGLAWGLRERDSYDDDWSKNFPDPKASSAWLEVLYHGQPVDSLLIVHVDGRCYVPAPTPVLDDSGSTPTVTGWTVTQWEYDVTRVAQALGGSNYDYADYIRRCGFEVVG